MILLLFAKLLFKKNEFIKISSIARLRLLHIFEIDKYTKQILQKLI